jgi:hypothetical protein
MKLKCKTSPAINLAYNALRRNSTFVVMNASSRGASRCCGRIEGLEITVLLLDAIQHQLLWWETRIYATYRSFDMVEIPHLGENGTILTAAQVWNGSGLSFERILELGKAVCRFVRWRDASSVYNER